MLVYLIPLALIMLVPLLITVVVRRRRHNGDRIVSSLPRPVPLPTPVLLPEPVLLPDDELEKIRDWVRGVESLLVWNRPIITLERLTALRDTTPQIREGVEVLWERYTLKDFASTCNQLEKWFIRIRDENLKWQEEINEVLKSLEASTTPEDRMEALDKLFLHEGVNVILEDQRLDVYRTMMRSLIDEYVKTLSVKAFSGDSGSFRILQHMYTKAYPWYLHPKLEAPVFPDNWKAIAEKYNSVELSPLDPDNLLVIPAWIASSKYA